jgi:hypothetical protein
MKSLNLTNKDFIEKLDKIRNADQPLQLVYEWVKTKYLTFSEFKDIIDILNSE